MWESDCTLHVRGEELKNVREPVVLKQRAVTERAELLLLVVVLKFSVLAAAHRECRTHDWAANGEKARGATEGSSLLPALRALIYSGR